MVYRNLIAELIKTGISPKEYERKVAEVLKRKPKTVHLKFIGKTEWTLDQMNAVNEHFFNGEQNLNYLFQKFEG